uniref:CdvA domain-containing protein n=1 Tax=Haemonchus contortus TaxID=6289 RepID=A0A7I4YK08_HAECO
MSLIFHKKPIGYSAKTLSTLLDKYSSYAEEINSAGDDRTQYEEYSTAVNLIAGGIKIIKSSRDSLQSLVDKLEKEFDEAKTRGNKKDLINDIEDIDSEYKFTEKIARANEMIYVLEARLTESRNKLQKLAQKLGINPKRSEIAQRNGAKEDETKNQSTEDPETDGDLAWLSEDMSDKLDNVHFDAEDAICRTLKPSQLKMPRFYGDEEDFPEYWAVFRTLVHDNKVLSTVEKNAAPKRQLER